MQEYYPKDYWKNKYEKKSPFKKHIHAIKFMYRSGGIVAVLKYYIVATKLLFLVVKERIKK